MVMKKISLAMAAVVFAGGVALAQPKSTAPAATTTPAASASSKPAKPATTLPAGTKINLNTATAAELDSLPEIGAARTKLIMSERAKGNFKDWADFDSRMSKTTVNKGVRAKIKDHVTF
jgi:DNA uptake protein ComE-like DNA-binding protein